MPPRKTHEQFLLELQAVNPNIEVLGRYVKNNVKILCRCKVDGYEWLIDPNHLLRGRGCPRCSKHVPYALSFYDRMAEMHPDIELLEPLTDGKTKILCRCRIDGYEWRTTPYSLLRGNKCPKCMKCARHSKEEVVAFLAKHNPHIVVVGDYVNSDAHIQCRCDKCGYVWDATPKHLFRGVGCPQCSGCLRKTHNAFVDEMSVKRPDVEVVGTYSGNKRPLLCRCMRCGNEWFGAPIALLRGHSGCVACKESYGEQVIRRYLESRGVEFVAQKRFDDCRDIHPLPFDFYIPRSNTAIEYDGQQHYAPVCFGGMTQEEALDQFEDRVSKDNIKTNYCESNHISLIRIPYTDFDKIEEILDKHLL